MSEEPAKARDYSDEDLEQVVEKQRAACARVRLYDDSGRFLGMGERDVQGLVHPRRLFVL